MYKVTFFIVLLFVSHLSFSQEEGILSSKCRVDELNKALMSDSNVIEYDKGLEVNRDEIMAKYFSLDGAEQACAQKITEAHVTASMKYLGMYECVTRSGAAMPNASVYMAALNKCTKSKP